MVFKFHFQRWLWRSTLIAIIIAMSPSDARADRAEALRALNTAKRLHSEGSYFRSARYAFAATEADGKLQAEAYSWITLGLVDAGLYQTASYFFIRTLQSGDRRATQRVLDRAEELILNVGGDLFRKYMIRHTFMSDYNESNRNSFLYSLGKDYLFKKKEKQAIQALSRITSSSGLWPFALQMRATAYALMGNPNQALSDFQECVQRSQHVSIRNTQLPSEVSQLVKEQNESMILELKHRCQAGVARVYFEKGQYADADRAYDEIDKESFVWADVIFEQAWNAFEKREYNRTLGKLISYQSQSLSFVFNPEVDVLRALSYLRLCYYNETNQIINRFNRKYEKIGVEVKRFVEANSKNLTRFYERGKSALYAPLHSTDDFNRMLNRFVRGTYFQNLVLSEKAVQAEWRAAQRFAVSEPGLPSVRRGFPAFLKVVLSWRNKTIRLLGGTFVKNSLLDYHSQLITAFENSAFIKLEMLKQAKQRLVNKRPQSSEKEKTYYSTRRENQLYWDFNGEFWLDEIGDYVFGLESSCGA